MNPYKMAWYQNTLVQIHELPPREQQSRKEKRTEGKAQYQGVARGMALQMGQAAALGVIRSVASHAAQSQMAGRLGVGLRIGGRIGLRVVPVVGIALLAYDLYSLGKWIVED